MGSFWSLVGCWVALAGAALAGPTTTTSPTTTTTSPTTTTTGPTTTTTTGPTTTTAPTTTTTTAPTTTSTTGTTAAPTTTTTTTTTTAAPTTTTTTTTTTAPPTTTTTTLLANLSGEYPFWDIHTLNYNGSFWNIDTGAMQVCLAGYIYDADVFVTLNRVVTFSYNVIGPISKATDKKVDVSFTAPVNLTLDITEPNKNEQLDVTLYNQTITVECPVKGTFKQPDGLASTEPALDRVTLKCDLGPDFAAFSDVQPLDPDLLQDITDAFAKRKNIKADVKSGQLRIKTTGSEVVPGSGTVVLPGNGHVPLSCDFGDD